MMSFVICRIKYVAHRKGYEIYRHSQEHTSIKLESIEIRLEGLCSVKLDIQTKTSLTWHTCDTEEVRTAHTERLQDVCWIVGINNSHFACCMSTCTNPHQTGELCFKFLAFTTLFLTFLEQLYRFNETCSYIHVTYNDVILYVVPP